LLRHGVGAVTIALLLTAGAVAVMVLLKAHSTYRFITQHIDEPTYRFMTAHRVAPLTWLSYGLNLVGATVVTLPVRLLATGYLIWRRRWAAMISFVLAVVTSEALITILKKAYNRPRPPHSLVSTSGASFPSGHAVATAVTAVALVIVLVPPGPKRRKWELWAIALTMVMGISRAYLGAHWLSDAVGGVLIGSALAVGWAVIVQWVRLRWFRPDLSAGAAHAGATELEP